MIQLHVLCQNYHNNHHRNVYFLCLFLLCLECLFFAFVCCQVHIFRALHQFISSEQTYFFFLVLRIFLSFLCFIVCHDKINVFLDLDC